MSISDRANIITGYRDSLGQFGGFAPKTNLGVMSFDILNSSENEVSLSLDSDSELKRLEKRQEQLDGLLKTYQKSGAVGWAKDTDKEIKELGKLISLKKNKTRSSMSIILIKSKAWGLVFLRFLMMISVVILTHFIIQRITMVRARGSVN